MTIRIDAQEIAQGLDDSAFFFAYQPIANLSTGATLCAEALLRWAHPTLGLLMPDAFLSLIHGAGLSHRLTQFGIDQLLADLPTLRQLYGDNVAAALNLSQKQLAEPGAATRVILDALDRTGEDPAAVHIEVVEDSTSMDMRRSAPAFADLRSAGIAIVLDDFGTGASSLTSLTEADYDGLKIDRSFVQGIVSSTTARSVVEAVLAFGRSTGISVVAEGVETSLELDALHDIGCTFGQGYYLGRPQSLSERTTNPTFEVALGPAHSADSVGVPSHSLTEQVAELFERINVINPRAAVTDFEEMLRHLEELDAESRTIGSTADLARCVIGRKVAIAASYHGYLDIAKTWAMRTSRLAEQSENWASTAEMLALVASCPWEDETNRALPVDALSRALQIRISKPMNAGDGALVDNAIGATFANLGLVEHALRWWKESTARHGDLATFGTAMCALNFVELMLEDLEGTVGGTQTAPIAISIAKLEQVLDRLAVNPFAPDAVAISLRCRVELVKGNTDQAEQVANAITQPLTDIVANSLALRAWAHLARTRGESEKFLQHTTDLVEHLSAVPLQSHHDWTARRLHAQALLMNGRADESAELSHELLVQRQANDRIHLATLFEWIRLKVDLNVRYDELFAATAPQVIHD